MLSSKINFVMNLNIKGDALLPDIDIHDKTSYMNVVNSIKREYKKFNACEDINEILIYQLNSKPEIISAKMSELLTIGKNVYQQVQICLRDMKAYADTCEEDNTNDADAFIQTLSDLNEIKARIFLSLANIQSILNNINASLWN